uniref:3-5 exonuclease n=1 Tax=Solanum tuberosum TaxID=4113 RepID=M1A2Q8_SOLTU
MVLQISLVDLKKENRRREKELKYSESRWIYDPYNVYVDEHRILTVVTGNYKTVAKWIKEVQNTAPNSKHGFIFVTICVERDPDMSGNHWEIKDGEDYPYDLLQVCTGSHCLLYRLPFPKYDDDPIPKAMKDFFADPRVMVIGMKMRRIMNRLDADFDIKFANPVDINILAELGLQRHDLDLRHYDLNRLSMTVLGKYWDVIRPEKPIAWFPQEARWWRDPMNPEKIKYATVDPYLCFMVSSKILDGMDDTWYPEDFEDFLDKKKKKKSKSKNKRKKKF